MSDGAVWNEPEGSGMRWVLAFFAGFLAVLAFHQPTLSLLAVLDVTKAASYSMQPVAPFGLPRFVSAAFWGGIWGLALYACSRRWREGPAYWIKAFLFGMVFPTLVAWFLVAPLKGLPMAAGGHWKGLLTGLCVNAAWGIGTALLLWLLFRRER